MMLGSTVRQYAASGAGNLGAMMVGICFIWLEPLMLKLTQPDSVIPMTTTDTSWLVASIEIGTCIATIPTGILADRFGRKPTLLATGPICLLGWIIVLTTRNIVALYVVRQLQGAAVITAFTVAPMYIAEISEPRIRGELSGHFQTMYYAGMLFVYIVGPLFDYQNYIYVCCILPFAFILTYTFVPESPYYLLMTGKTEKALESLKWLRNSNEVSKEFEMMKQSVHDEAGGKGSWKDLFATKRDRKALLIVQSVCAIKYLNGMSAIVSYATQNFQTGSSVNAHYLTIGLGTLLCVTTIFSAFISDSVGRRPLLLWSTFGSVVFNIIIGTYFYLVEKTSVDVSSYSWIMLLSLAGFCIASNVGLGPLVQTIQAEYFPSKTRSIGGALTGVTGGLTTFISLKQFQVLTDEFGLFANYCVYTVLGIAGYILLYNILPETAGKSLGQIQKDMVTNQEPVDEIVMGENMPEAELRRRRHSRENM